MQALRVWVGPVSSAKTTGALQTAQRLLRQGHDLVLVRPACSLRDHEEPGWLVTKNRQRHPSLELEHARQIPEAADGATVLWIDEPMLFPDEEIIFDLVQEIRHRARVLISGLSATSELQVFGTSMPRLLAVADDVVWCKADCDDCGGLERATRSFFVKGTKKGPVAVGGEESYKALCPDCWTTRNNTRPRA